MLIMNNRFTKKKRLFAVIFALALALVLCVGLWGYQYLQYQKRVADDRHRYESALTDMNKFFDALGIGVADREVKRICDYGVGPWGDQGDLNCSARIIGKYNSAEDPFLDSSKDKLLAWVELDHGSGPTQDQLYWIDGTRDNLSCGGYFSNSMDVELYCRGQTEYQHYQRVDR